MALVEVFQKKGRGCGFRGRSYGPILSYARLLYDEYIIYILGNEIGRNPRK